MCFSEEAFCRVFEDTFDPKISALAMKSDFMVRRPKKSSRVVRFDFCEKPNFGTWGSKKNEGVQFECVVFISEIHIQFKCKNTYESMNVSIFTKKKVLQHIINDMKILH